jgi:hypothetical protein
VLLQPQAKMRDRSPHLSTADVTAIAIAAAGGTVAIAIAAASAIAADFQGDKSRQINENDGPRHMGPSFSASALPDLESGTGIGKEYF